MSLASSAGGFAAFVGVAVESLAGACFSRRTPPAEPALPVVGVSGFAALRERGCFVGAAFAVADEGFVDMFEIVTDELCENWILDGLLA